MIQEQLYQKYIGRFENGRFIPVGPTHKIDELMDYLDENPQFDGEDYPEWLIRVGVLVQATANSYRIAEQFIGAFSQMARQNQDFAEFIQSRRRH
jgi:hypothetical protein